jgi:hypothetical protein
LSSSYAARDGGLGPYPSVGSATTTAVNAATFMRKLAPSGGLEELSNSKDGDDIDSYVHNKGKVRERGAGAGRGVTRPAVLFIVYETGRHGPQIGFHLCLVREVVRPADAREALKGAIAQDALELLVMSCLLYFISSSASSLLLCLFAYPHSVSSFAYRVPLDLVCYAG